MTGITGAVPLATPRVGAPSTDAGATHLDVLVVGAGISGVCAGHYLQTECPGKTYAILEGRDAIGGTWDLFRYPGLRSDSDLFTFGFSFRPWRSDKGIADGASILAYVRETAAALGIDRRIRFGHRVVRAAWDTPSALWTVEAVAGPDARPVRFTCGFLYVCGGYYDYEAGYMPGWAGMDRFPGRIVHPQAWPADLDYAGKRVVVIGSGATAVTLVPAMAERAAHVTMLQRSPTYIVSMPSRDRIAAWLRRRLPDRAAHALARWKNILVSMFFYNLSQRRPELMKSRILQGARAQLGPGYDIGTHFTPSYNPWDQRLCLVPDGDLFKALRAGRASIVTDRIESFTQTGLRLASGAQLDADVIVTATGLRLTMLGKIDLRVDGRAVDAAGTLLYKGMMVSDVPNLAVAIGYTNASWTLKCELTSAYVCRLLKRMDRGGYAYCIPEKGAAVASDRSAIGLTSGYIQRAADVLPKQGLAKPWRVHQNYVLDMAALRFGRLDDGTMRFGGTRAARKAA